MSTLYINFNVKTRKGRVQLTLTDNFLERNVMLDFYSMGYNFKENIRNIPWQKIARTYPHAIEFGIRDRNVKRRTKRFVLAGIRKGIIKPVAMSTFWPGGDGESHI